MKKKLLLSLICAASVSLGLADATAVGAATTGQSAEPTVNIAANKAAATNEAATNSNQTAANKPAASKATGSTNNALAVSYAGKLVKLRHNSYVYNKNGKRIKSAAKLKKGMLVSVSSFTATKGKSLLQIDGKKHYINANNVKLAKAATYETRKKTYICNSKGKRLNGYFKKGKTVLVFKTKKIHKTKFVGITFLESLQKYYVKWSDLKPETGQGIK